MKEWWMNLALREKQVLMAGSAAVILFLLYQLIFSPLSHKIESEREHIQENRELLNWMQQADLQLKTLTKNTQIHASSSSLLGSVQTEINKTPLATHLKQLRQSDSNTVQFTLQQTNFDELIKWLDTVWQTQGIIVAEISITPLGTPGIVNADVVVK